MGGGACIQPYKTYRHTRGVVKNADLGILVGDTHEKRGILLQSGYSVPCNKFEQEMALTEVDFKGIALEQASCKRNIRVIISRYTA
jgi:hypothetical protein